MIRIFDSTETNFNHHENVLRDVISCKVTEEENGTFFVELVAPIDHRIEENKILKVPTPRGEQLFRISKPVRSLDKGKRVYSVFGMHIFYDLLDNFILNIRPTDVTAINAGKAILNGTELPHNFTFKSNVQGLNTSNFVRMNPVQAMIGNQENSLLNRWGGFLYRDNFEIDLRATSLDRGYEIAFGKNLTGVKEDIDVSGVVTRLYPTVVIEGSEVTALPEKYVDSPLINSYHQIKIKEHRITLTDEQKLLPIEQIYQLMRTECQEQFNLGLDKPRINYKVDFVELSKTEQYRDLSVLETLDISDTVSVNVLPLNLSVDARLVKYTYDSLRERFLTCELGNLKSRLTSQTSEIKKLIEETTENIIDGEISALLKSAIERITGHRGGYKYDIFNPDGQPSGTIYMDTEDINTAQHYIIINNQGIAFGDNGVANPPKVAIDIEGNVVAGSGFFESLKTNLIESDLGQSLDLSSHEAIINKVERQEIANLVSNDIYDAGLETLNNELKTFIESQTTLTKDEFEVMFSQYSQIVNEYSEDTDVRFNELYTWFRITPEGLELGESENPILLKIKPDRIAFEEGGQEVAYISDSSLYITHANIVDSMQWGKFRWVHRDNGNFSLV